MSLQKYLLVLTLLALCSALKDIVSPLQLKKIVEKGDWVFLKIYSKDCGYCKEIEPVCEDLETTNDNVTFAQLVGTEQKEFIAKNKVTIYPTLFLYHGHLDLPIIHHGARDKENLQGWIRYVTTFQLPKVQDLNLSIDVVYKGPKGPQYQIVKILALRNVYTVYGWEETEGTPQVLTSGQSITDFGDMQSLIRKANAKLQNFHEGIWYSIHVKKMEGVLLVNHNSSAKFDQILGKQAQLNPEIVFSHIEPNYPEYAQVLDYLSADMDTAVYSLQPSTGGVFKLQGQITQQSIHQFVEGLKKGELKPHRKSQKTVNPHILTRDNQKRVNQLPKDVVLFMYDETKPYSAKLFQIINYIIALLEPNKNIHVFGCNPLKNDLTLEIPIEPLPMIVLFKNNMKHDPVYFLGKQINPDVVIEFIKEHTTFDWVQDQVQESTVEQDKKNPPQEQGNAPQQL